MNLSRRELITVLEEHCGYVLTDREIASIIMTIDDLVERKAINAIEMYSNNKKEWRNLK